MTMNRERNRCPPRRKPRRRMKSLPLLGAVLIALGLLLLFLCIPGWAWAALAGCLLIAAGWLLIFSGWR